MRVGVICTGSRTWTDAAKVGDVLTAILPGVVHVGDCPRRSEIGPDGDFVDASADYLVADFVRLRNQSDLKVHYADWEAHARAAGPIRNQAMIDSFLEETVDVRLCIAFIDSRCFTHRSGTADCMRRAHAAEITVLEVRSE